MAFFEHGRNRYYYFDAGAGTPVVLLHGLGNSGRAWSDQVAALLRLEHRVIVPDLLGHGASSDAPASISARGQALGILALLDHLGLESAQLVGLSLGGMVALELACEVPAAVESLAVAGTFLTMKAPHRAQMLDEWIDALAQPDGCLKRFKATWPALVGESFAASPQGQRLYQAWHAQAATQGAQNQINWCQGMKHYDLSERLQRIDAPTLVLACEHDRMSPVAEADEIARRIARCRRVTLTGEGHVFNVPHALAFNYELAFFLQEHPQHA
ncbi:alpha/beta hydrolase [Pseudomonas entomophila]|uniref:alpha/beta fold hydrolase n=1 Tax=Pseudomonas entomophila TaxID=312306 RepID=UPI0023D80CA6|nr:alpha/beta hydrolase [Pseudomonas entomophila]MDF0732065.1 alpha/beta hydrolase [Pseudomonas entomophila]